jgi:DNA-directed RNA polymerase specialized sigma subunit
MDRHSEYQRVRSSFKDVSLNEIVMADLTADIAVIYEEAQLLESLREALLTLDNAERCLVQYLYYDALTERKAATLLKIPRTTLNKRKKKIIQKLRKHLIDWL